MCVTLVSRYLHLGDALSVGVEREFVVTFRVAGYVYVVQTLHCGSGIELLWTNHLLPNLEPTNTRDTSAGVALEVKEIRLYYNPNLSTVDLL